MAARTANRIDADDLAVFSADVGRVDGEVRHVPMRATPFLPFLEALADGILVGAAERGEHQFAGVGLAGRHRHAGASLVNLLDRVSGR
jgi:hypothetical protein